MTGRPHAAAPVPAPAALQRLLRGLLLGYALFVVYGSLVPLNFHPLPLDQAWQHFVDAPFLVLGIGSRADWVANLLLFVPLAFLARAVLPAPAGGVAAALLPLGLWLGCSVLAAAIEFTQTFFPGRTVSLNDPLAESLGAAIGLLLHRGASRPLLAWLAGWWAEESGRPLVRRLLHGYLVALAVMSVMPLDLTISPVEIYHKAREGRVVLLPFADTPHDLAQAIYELATDVLVWLPVGLLWRWAGRTPLQVLQRGALAAAAVELLQLFVWSRVSSSSDVITGALGCWLGAWLAGRGQPRGLVALGKDTASTTRAAPAAGDAGLAADGDALPRQPWLALLGLWLLLALGAFWYPFNLRLDGDWLQARWHEAWRVPFATYYQGTEFHALNELLRKLLFFLPGGLLWARHVAGDYPWRRPALMRAGSLCLPLLALLVEGGQLLLPDKVADLTDALIESSGAWLGLALGRRLWFGDTRGAPAEAPQWAPPAPARPAGHAAAEPVQTVSSPAWRLLLAALALALLLATAWQGWQALPPAGTALRPQALAWLALWLALVAVGGLASARQPWAPMAAFFACQFATPRYGPVMGLLLATPALPGLAGLSGLAALAERGRWAPPAGWRALPDALFLLFFAWVGMLGWMAWQRVPHESFQALYHPANYAGCALLYLAARLAAHDAAGLRRLAIGVVGAVAVATAVQLATDQFALNGHIALLLVLALVLLQGLWQSAVSPGERACWMALGLLAVLGVVLNQNRSAGLALLAVGALALVRSRATRRWGPWLWLLPVAVPALAGLWWLGLLDRFLVLADPALATRPDALAQATVQSRLALWDAAWAIVQAHPVAGVGPGLFEHALARQAPQLDQVPAHNTWLTLLAETGVVGVALGTLAFLAAWLLPAGAAPAPQPGALPVRASARAGLLACAVFGLFNSRADFAWAYALAGLAVGAATGGAAGGSLRHLPAVTTLSPPR